MAEQRPPATTRLASALIVRGLGVVHVAAFLSLWVQVQGLIGSQGLLPVHDYLSFVSERWDGGGLWQQLPTLLWLDSSDAMLHALCGAGVLGGVLLALGVAPIPMLLVEWLLYLSLAVGCRTFLNFQWDALLLEATLLAILLAPWGAAVPLERWPSPSRWGVWAMRWLVMRLMLLSGAVKLLSGDPSWRDGTAMSFHFWTQPLPNPLGWLAWREPMIVHRAETFATFVLELLFPILACIPGRCRRIAFVGFLALQLVIGLTGNYGFFNFLTSLLCFSLLDDADWPSRVRAWLVRHEWRADRPARRWPTGAAAALASVSFVLTSVAAWQRLDLDEHVGDLPAPIMKLAGELDPFRSFNAYGLFAVMTKERREIVIEGSDDGQTWKEYRLHWQPGDLDRMPPIALLHMPRVDWQMWFASLDRWNSPRQSWLHALCARILEGSPSVRGFLRTDPFDGKPPRMVRTMTWDYRFTTLKEKLDTGAWWTRSDEQPYGPTMSRR